MSSSAPSTEKASGGAAATPIAVYARNLGLTVKTDLNRRTLLANIDLDIPRGSFVSIIGPSGCGKSSLLKVLAGITPCTAGSLHIGGYEIHQLKQNYPLATGYLPQFGAFHEELTVHESLTYAAALRLPKSVNTEVRADWLNYVIKLSGIEQFLQQPYKTLSGGQQRRVALAEELIGDPPFLFLDELTSGLDPHSELEMMRWLEELCRKTGKTIILVTHAIQNIALCDIILFMSGGRLLYSGPSENLLKYFEANSIESLYAAAPKLMEKEAPPLEDTAPPLPQVLKTARPPGGLQQLGTLLHRQLILLRRDRGQLILQLILVLSFPILVAIFGYRGLPGVRKLSLGLESNVVQTLTEQLLYSKELFHSASLISGLAMFQVILLTLMGANNGAREIAKEREVLNKELRSGLSPTAYTTVKFIIAAGFSIVQAAWMTIFVKTACGFSGDLLTQAAIFFCTTFAMSSVCLAISARSHSAERASLSAIYLVGLQLPLSGAVLALPEIVNFLTRPFISAYWGWSGYLRSLDSSQYDIVKQTTDTSIGNLEASFLILAIHVFVSALLTHTFVLKRS